MSRIQHALITGASSGIGQALARELANRGARLDLCARRLDRLESLAADLRARGAEVHVESIDVRDPDAVRRFVREADGRSASGLDLVIANAGVGRAAPAAELSFEEIDETLGVNVRGAFATLHAGLEVCLPRGRGTLCGISSLASLGGMPGSGAYAASKAALSTFLQTLRLDLRGTGVRVVDVQPGFVVSEMTGGGTEHPVFRSRSMVATEEAARRIVDGVQGGRAVVSFPRSESVPLRVLRSGPRVLWDAVMGRLR